MQWMGAVDLIVLHVSLPQLSVIAKILARGDGVEMHSSCFCLSTYSVMASETLSNVTTTHFS